MKKPLTNDAILDIVYDIADERGMRIDDFLELLQRDYADSRVAYDDGTLPPEIVEELNSAKALRREMRESKRKADEDASLKADIAAFRELFPDVKTDEIPKTVWDEVSGGTDLRHAYALYAMTNRAEQANRDAASRSGAAASDVTGSTEPSFTPEQIERMSVRDIAKNYGNVVRSMKNWR